MNGYITYTQGSTGAWVCWMTETQPPRYATVESMFVYPGEVHFGIGATKEEALARLEAGGTVITSAMHRDAEARAEERESRGA